MKQPRPRPRDHRLGAQRPGRHLRLRRGVLRRDPRRHRERGHRCPRRGWRAGSPGGPTSTSTSTGRAHRRRPGLRGDEPQGAAADPAGAGRRARRHGALPHRGARTPTSCARRYDLVVAADGLNSAIRDRVRRRLRPHSGPAAQQVHLARHRPGLRGVPVLRQADAELGHHADPRLPVLRRRARPSSSRCTRTSGAGPGSTPPRAQAFPPGRQRRVRRRAARARSSPTNSRATRCSPTTPSGSTSPPSATSAGTTATSCCSATPRTPRTSRSAPAPSWPWRTPSPSPPACTSTPTVDGRARRLRGRSAARWSSRPSARPRPVAGVVREHRHVRRPGPAQFVFNLLTRSRRITFENLRTRDAEFAARWRRDFAPQPHGRAQPTAGAGDVPAGADRRARAEEPGRRLADGHVLRRRRRARTTSTSSTSARRRWAAPAW